MVNMEFQSEGLHEESFHESNSRFLNFELTEGRSKEHFNSQPVDAK